MKPGWWGKRIPFFVIVATALIAWIGAIAWGVRTEFYGTRSWEHEIASFEERDLTNPPPEEAVLFVGSSSVKLWQTLKTDLPRYRVFRRGFGGAHMSDVVKYARRVILPYDLEMIVVHAGGNDIAAGIEPMQVLEDFKNLVETIHDSDSQMRIAYLSLKPSPARWHLQAKFCEVNQLIKDYAATDDRLVFINVYDRMLTPSGQPRTELFAEDGLHLSKAGYKIWADSVRPLLPQSARKKMDEKSQATAHLPATIDSLTGR